jgi:glycerol-3-phosphate cytidylyltransferase
MSIDRRTKKKAKVAKNKSPQRILTYGTFDLFHYGHLRILKRAKKLGDFLMVGVSTDEFNLLKNKHCEYPYDQRAKIVKALKCVDKVIPEISWDQKLMDIQKYRIDTLVMGADWMGKFDYLSPYCKIVYLERTQGISTTEIKASILRESGE